MEYSVPVDAVELAPTQRAMLDDNGSLHIAHTVMTREKSPKGYDTYHLRGMVDITLDAVATLRLLSLLQKHEAVLTRHQEQDSHEE